MTYLSDCYFVSNNFIVKNNFILFEKKQKQLKIIMAISKILLINMINFFMYKNDQIV